VDNSKKKKKKLSTVRPFDRFPDFDTFDLFDKNLSNWTTEPIRTNKNTIATTIAIVGKGLRERERERENASSRTFTETNDTHKESKNTPAHTDDKLVNREQRERKKGTEKSREFSQTYKQT
jgi:hypothetical protein